MRLLDLFCGAGGASMGYHRAGFEIVGVDIVPQPRYPFDFIQADALGELWSGFDAVHASPPCQAYSTLARRHPERCYPDLIAATRALLKAMGVPYVIENVPGASLIEPVTLCGSMFGLGANGRQLRRHRLFECSFFVLRPSCQHVRETIGVYGNGGGGRPKPGLPSASGGYKGTAAERREAMGIDWMNRPELSEAIPPAYTEHVGHFLRCALAP